MGPNGAFSGAYLQANDLNGDGFVDGTNLIDVDTDGDGKKDRLDLDSDGDGITDAVEANNGVMPSNMDSNGQYPAVYAKANDTDNDGLVNAIDPDNGGTPLLVPDNDSDGIKDYRDLNSDGDALTDNQEGFDPDRIASGTDTDGDGIDNAFDTNNGGVAANLPDDDADGIPDYIDKCLISVQNGDWDNPATWGGSIPTCNTCVVINHTVNLTQSSCVSDVTINCPGIINFNSNVLNIKGDFLNNCNAGSLISDPKLEFSGTKTQTLCGTNTVFSLTVNKTAASPDNTLNTCSGANTNINNTVTLTAGVLNSTGSASFVFTSNPSYTAGVNGTGTGSMIGNYTMNRFLGASSCEGYVSLGAPFATTYNNFTNLYYQGFTGTYYATNWPNTYWYNERVTGSAENGYTVPSNITNSIPKGRGFMSYQFANTLSSNIALTGPFSLNSFTYDNLYGDALKMYSGAVNSSIDDGYNLIANPFPATIDWKLDAGWSKFGCCDAIYVHNRCLNQYSSFVAGISVNGGTQYIGPLQSFWIKAHRSDASLTVTRNAIVNTSQQALYKTTAPKLSVLKFKVESGTYSDESALSFGDTTLSNGLGSWYGASKFITNAANYPSIYSVQEMPYGKFNMAINMMPEINTNIKVVQLVCKPGFNGNHAIRFSGMEQFDNSYCIMLNDSLTGHWYNLRTDSVLNLNLDSAKAFEKRFKLHFRRTVEIVKDYPVCSGTQLGKAIVKAPFGNGIFTWKDNNGLVLRTSTTNVKYDTLSNVPEGHYKVTFVSTTSNFCSTGEQTFEIETAPIMNLQVAVTNVENCLQADGAISANISGGKAPFTWKYSNGANTQNLVQIKEGKYMLNVKDANQCSIDTLITVTGPGRAYADFMLSADTLSIGLNNTVLISNHSTPHIKREWQFGDGNTIDTSYNASHTYVNSGIYTISLRVWADSCDDVFSKTIIVLNPLSLSNAVTSNTISIYPNPAKEEIFIQSPIKIKSLQIIDALGKVLDLHLLGSKNSINVKNLAKGVYHLRIFDNQNNFKDIKFVKE
jgi:hypothetical protein